MALTENNSISIKLKYFLLFIKSITSTVKATKAKDENYVKSQNDCWKNEVVYTVFLLY